MKDLTKRELHDTFHDVLTHRFPFFLNIIPFQMKTKNFLNWYKFFYLLEIYQIDFVLSIYTCIIYYSIVVFTSSTSSRLFRCFKR